MRHFQETKNGFSSSKKFNGGMVCILGLHSIVTFEKMSRLFFMPGTSSLLIKTKNVCFKYVYRHKVNVFSKNMRQDLYIFY